MFFPEHHCSFWLHSTLNICTIVKRSISYFNIVSYFLLFSCEMFFPLLYSPSFKGWFFCLFVSWRMDAIKKKMQAMKVEKGGGILSSYSPYFSQTISSRQIHGSNTKPLTHVWKEWIGRGPRSFPVVLSGSNSLPPQALTIPSLTLSSLCVAGIAWTRLHVSKLKGEEGGAKQDDSKKRASLFQCVF